MRVWNDLGVPGLFVVTDLNRGERHGEVSSHGFKAVSSLILISGLSFQRVSSCSGTSRVLDS